MEMTCHAFDPSRVDEFVQWTFPAYRHLLDLEPTERNPQHGDRRRVRPAAFSAEVAGDPAGLILGCLPSEDEMDQRPAELLSLFVRQEKRHLGIAGSLLEHLECAFSEAGSRAVEATYMAPGPSIEYLERLLRRSGWSPPEGRMTVARFTIEQAESTPWYGRYRQREKMDLFPWLEVTEEELERLRDSHRRTGWIAEDLVPWQFDLEGIEPRSSLGIRVDGEVRGWVINHLMSGDTVRFTCSFIHPELKRRGRILPAYTESIRRVGEAGYERCMFTVPAHHPEMVNFVRRWCGPWCGFVGQTRGSVKELRRQT